MKRTASKSVARTMFYSKLIFQTQKRTKIRKKRMRKEARN
jgi:translation initiation factor IF-3